MAAIASYELEFMGTVAPIVIDSMTRNNKQSKTKSTQVWVELIVSSCVYNSVEL